VQGHANDANVSYFSPDKVKAFEKLIFVGKKSSTKKL
jgi:hypothetical protein